MGILVADQFHQTGRRFEMNIDFPVIANLIWRQQYYITANVANNIEELNDAIIRIRNTWL
jgi:hypothetical protein